MASLLADKRADASAELAAKQANYEVLLKEERLRESIRELEKQQQKVLEEQKCELERLQAEKQVQAAQARLKAYNQETEDNAAGYTNNERKREPNYLPVSTAPSTSGQYFLTQTFPHSLRSFKTA